MVPDASDKQDTLLGNLAAGTVFHNGTDNVNVASISKADTSASPVTFGAMDTADYNLTAEFAFTISVTQVD